MINDKKAIRTMLDGALAEIDRQEAERKEGVKNDSETRNDSMERELSKFELVENAVLAGLNERFESVVLNRSDTVGQWYNRPRQRAEGQYSVIIDGYEVYISLELREAWKGGV